MRLKIDEQIDNEIENGIGNEIEKRSASHCCKAIMRLEQVELTRSFHVRYAERRVSFHSHEIGMS